MLYLIFLLNTLLHNLINEGVLEMNKILEKIVNTKNPKMIERFIFNAEKKALKELERDDLDEKSEGMLREILAYVDEYRSVEPKK